MSSAKHSSGNPFACKYVSISAALTAGAFLIYGLYRCSARRGSEQDGPVRNSALLFAKPHAHGAGCTVVPLIQSGLVSAGLTIDAQGERTGAEILRDGLIDKHYSAIATYATKQSPAELPVPAEKKAEFLAKYKQEWSECVANGTLLNMRQALEKTGLTVEEFSAVCEAARARGMRLGPGCYVAPLEKYNLYVVNGFYAKMRDEYVQPTTRVTWFVVSWPPEALSWKKFRASALGATDPTKSEAGSLRRIILDQATSLGLSFVPSTGNNCVHGSASPLEGLNERMIWTQATIRGDSFGKLLLKMGLSESVIENMLTNPTVDGKPLFDIVEDTDSLECATMLRDIAHKLA